MYRNRCKCPKCGLKFNLHTEKIIVPIASWHSRLCMNCKVEEGLAVWINHPQKKEVQANG